LKLAAGTVLLSPFLPLLFMGEEHGEIAPFRYFVDHSDPALLEAVRAGRKKEFEAFCWEQDMPDSCSVETFEACRIKATDLTTAQRHLRSFYQALIECRRSLSALRNAERDSVEPLAIEAEHGLVLRYAGCAKRGRKSSLEPKDRPISVALNFSAKPIPWPIFFPGRVPGELLLNSADEKWGGPGGSPIQSSPRSVSVFAS
jgi:maltooligosyltrehalose trehalohydrolase